MTKYFKGLKLQNAKKGIFIVSILSLESPTLSDKYI